MANWEPSASIGTLRQRAEIIARIRSFFYQRQVMEVETPLLWSTTATDPHLDSIRLDQVFRGDPTPYFLQTSPEFAMKKLLAAGSGSIFQICKAFRQDERSRRHNPEFTMLEWYRTGFDTEALMDEVQELVTLVTGCKPPLRLTYRQLFQQTLGVDPHSCNEGDLLAIARQHLDFDETGFGRDDLLHLLLAEVIEPVMAPNCFVFDFPASMAALATITTDTEGARVARRFELFLGGMEIANGYQELLDAEEQLQRFEQDNKRRRASQREVLPLDHDLITALSAGIPVCAGVAVGVDRLIMTALQASSIDEVIAYPLDHRDTE